MTLADPLEIDRLHRDALAIAHDARRWFDGPGRIWRLQLPLADQAAVATEHLRITARVLAVTAWTRDPAQARSMPPFAAAAYTGGGELPRRSPLIGWPGGEIARAARQLVDFVAQRAPARQKPPETSHGGLWRL